MNANQRTHTEFTEVAGENFDFFGKPAPEEVAQRAYHHFERNGSQHGNHLDHWLSAEAELLAEREEF